MEPETKSRMIEVYRHGPIFNYRGVTLMVNECVR